MGGGGIGAPSTTPAAFILFAAWLLLFQVLTPTSSAFNVTTITFDEGYSPLFGDREGNLIRSSDGRTVKLQLDRYSGSGFISSDLYSYGMFSASIKLPADYTAGVVVAFYTSNGDLYEKNHDELDFEFLGNIRGRDWKVQTNVYGNGSTSRGREERYLLPFDPTAAPHRYSILWLPNVTIFYVDDTPIREIQRNSGMGGDYPSKPMSLYATIWDGSPWATNGGRYRVNYKYSPFVAEFSQLVLRGCRADPVLDDTSTPGITTSTDANEFDDGYDANADADADSDADANADANTEPSEPLSCENARAELAAAGLADLTPQKRRAMREFRAQHMVYSVCYDRTRYPVPLPECEVVATERERFKTSGHLIKLAERRRRRSRRVRVSRRRGRMPAHVYDDSFGGLLGPM